jgi:phosphotriesterase-related protein
MDWFDDEFLAQVQPNWNFMHISRDVLPMMRARVIPDDQITAMMVDTPRRILDHGAGY